jgi:hypothetical protein
MGPWYDLQQSCIQGSSFFLEIAAGPSICLLHAGCIAVRASEVTLYLRGEVKNLQRLKKEANLLDIPGALNAQAPALPLCAIQGPDGLRASLQLRRSARLNVSPEEPISSMHFT